MISLSCLSLHILFHFFHFLFCCNCVYYKSQFLETIGKLKLLEGTEVQAIIVRYLYDAFQYDFREFVVHIYSFPFVSHMLPVPYAQQNGVNYLACQSFWPKTKTWLDTLGPTAISKQTGRRLCINRGLPYPFCVAQKEDTQ